MADAGENQQYSKIDGTPLVEYWHINPKVKRGIVLERPRIIPDLDCLEGQFLSSLGFCEPLEDLVFTTVPPGAVANLFSPQGPTFTVGPGDPNEDPNYCLMVYYDPKGPTGPPSTEGGAESKSPYIGLGAVLANPLLKHGEPVATYLKLTQWDMDPRQRPSDPRVFLVSLHKAGETFVLPGAEEGILVDPHVKDIRPEQALTSDPPAYRVDDLRFFQVHSVLISREGEEEMDQKICFPRLNGGEARLIPSREQLIAEDSKRHFGSCQVSVRATLTPADESHHWSLIEDTTYTELLASQEAAAAQKAKSLKEAAELTMSQRLRLEELDREKASRNLTASAKVVEGLLRRLRSYRLQYLYEEGSIRVLDRTLLRAFTQEFTRVNLIVWEDLGNEITTLINSLGTKFDALIDYIKGTSQEEPDSYSRSVMVGKAHQCRLEWATELLALGVRMEGAKNKMEDLLRQRLREVGAQEETEELVSNLAERWTRLENAVQNMVLSEEMEDPAVATRVGVALAGGPTFQGNYVLGSLEAMLGSLGLSSEEDSVYPRSTSMAIAERQIADLSRAFGEPERNFLTERLRPNYAEAFQQQRPEAIPKAFQEPLLPGLIATMDRLRLETPGFQPAFRVPLSEEELSKRESAFKMADQDGRERIFKGLLASYKMGLDLKVKAKEEPQPDNQREPPGGFPDETPVPPEPRPPPHPKAERTPLPEPHQSEFQGKPRGIPGLNTRPPPGLKILPKGASKVDVSRIAEWQRSHPASSVQLGELDPDLLAGAKVTEQGEPTPLFASGGGSTRYQPTIKVSKRTLSTGDAEEPPSKVPRRHEDYEDLQGKISGNATFRTDGGGRVHVVGTAVYSGPRRGSGVRKRGGEMSASGRGGPLLRLFQDDDEDPPPTGRAANLRSRLTPAPSFKKKGTRKSKEDEEDEPVPAYDLASKGGEGGEQAPSEPVGEDEASKLEEIEGKYPPKQEDEEDEPGEPDEFGPLPVLDPIVHDLKTQEEADSWRDGVLRKRAWIYFWDRRIAKEVRGGILGVPDGELPCYQRVACSPYFQPIRAKEVPKNLGKAARKNVSPGKGGASAKEPLDVSPFLVPILQREKALATGAFDKDRPTGGALTIYEWGTLTKFHPEVIQQWKGQTPPALVVVLPIDMEAATTTYCLDLFHEARCLHKTTVKSRDSKIKKQVAFCPYCGVMSENNESHLNHVRRHTRIEFLCGGCLSMHSPFLTPKGSGSMSHHLRSCKSLKECRDQKRQRYDQARHASASTRVEEAEDDDEEDDDDNDDALDLDYQP